MKNLNSIIWVPGGEMRDNLNTFLYSAQWETYKLSAMALIQDNEVKGISVTFYSPRANVRDIRTSDINQVERFLIQISEHGQITEFAPVRITVKKVNRGKGAKFDVKNKFG